LVNGALNVCEPPQLFEMVTVPVLGTEIPGPPVTVRFPLTEYVLLLHALGDAVKFTPQVKEQSEDAEPLVWENVIVPG
jgi:hypothetical protein